MVDTIPPEERSALMRRVRSRDTGPELQVRRLLHAMGARFRLHRRDLPGTPDITLPRHRAVILVHGCFWHAHADPACRLARMPKSRLEFWRPKLEATAARDRRDRSALEALGWRVLVAWECELRDMEQVRNRIASFLKEGA